MKPSKGNPDYSVVLITRTGAKYEITPVINAMELSHQKEQLAQCVTIDMMNTLYQGKWLTSMIEVRQRIFVYANDGERHEEVFRGFIWSVSYTSATDERELTIRCYDNLIFWQESEDSAFFTAGWSTKDILASLCSKWGIPLKFNYQSITHGKLPLRGMLSDLVTSDVLDLAKKQTGKKYAIVMEKETAVIRTAGDNDAYYKIVGASNAIHTKNETTMEGMTTQVVILGKADDAGKSPIEATVTGDTGTYGTLQKLQDRDEETTLADAKKEAQSIVDENGKPKKTYELKCSDIPWVRKGDRIYISVGGIYKKMLIVWGTDRSIKNSSKDLTLSLEDP